MENNIKTLRIRAGLTQKELAEISGVPQNRISEYERIDSLANITVGYLYKIATAMGTTIDEIISPIKEETKMEIRERIIETIADAAERALNGNSGNYYSAYIDRSGRIYIDEETDSHTMPEAVYSGKDRTICSIQSSLLWSNDDERYETYASYLDEEQQAQLDDYIEKEEENHYTASLCGIAYIEENFPDIVKEADEELRNDILNDLRYRLENGTSEYEETISEIVEWVKS